MGAIVPGGFGSRHSAAKVQQRQAFEDTNFFYFTDKDGVITGNVGLHDTAIEIGQGMSQYLDSTFHLVVMYAQGGERRRVALRIGEKL